MLGPCSIPYVDLTPPELCPYDVLMPLPFFRRVTLLLAILAALAAWGCGKKSDATSQPSQNVGDLARVILTIEAGGNPEINVENDLKEIDRIIKVLDSRMVSDDPYDKLKAIARYLRTDLAVSYDEQQPELHTLLVTHRGNCEATSLLYVVLGQRLNIPIRPVIAPTHMFVVCDAGAERLYWETAGRGRLVGTDKEAPRRKPFTEMTLAQTPAIVWESEAIILLRQRKPNDAMRAAREAERLFPATPGLGITQGDAYAQLGQYEEAIRAYMEDVKVNPAGPGLLRTSEIETGLGRYQDAARSICQYSRTHPADAKSIVAQARLLAILGGYDDAIGLLNQATQSWPKDSDAWYHKSYYQYDMEDYAAAIESAHHARTLRPTDAEMWSLEARCHFDQKQWDEAIADSTKAIELRDVAYDRGIRGAAHNNKQEYSAALADAEQGLKLEPDNSYAQLIKAVALVHLERPQEAEAELRQAIRSSAPPECFFLRAQCWWQLGKYVCGAGDFGVYLVLEPAFTARDAVGSAFQRWQLMIVKSILVEAPIGNSQSRPDQGVLVEF